MFDAPDRIMDGMGMFASTQRPPLSHIEALPPHQEVLPDLLRSPEHEQEVVALAALLPARVLAKPPSLQCLQLVLGKPMVTETTGELAYPRALVLLVVVVEGDVGAGGDVVLGVPELPLQHLPGPDTRPVLLQPRHHRPRGLGLDRVKHLQCVTECVLELVRSNSRVLLLLLFLCCCNPG